MTDDLVTQIQNDIAFRLRLQDKVSNLYEIHHPYLVRVPTLYAEAADEIERLRAENRQQGKAIQIMGERWTLCEQCQVINRKGWDNE